MAGFRRFSPAGGEHQVFFQGQTRPYIKANLLDRKWGYGLALGSHVHGATPSEYPDRLALQNQVFHHDIRLERSVANGGKPIIITSQPAIKGTKATQPALDKIMTAWGARNWPTALIMTNLPAC